MRADEARYPLEEETMMHLFLDKGPWFRAKRYGYGAGLPFKWQGWVLMLAHMALVIGLAVALGD